jgi:hypothetical protein
MEIASILDPYAIESPKTIPDAINYWREILYRLSHDGLHEVMRWFVSYTFGSSHGRLMEIRETDPLYSNPDVTTVRYVGDWEFHYPIHLASLPRDKSWIENGD